MTVVGEYQTAPAVHHPTTNYFNGHIPFSPPLNPLLISFSSIISVQTSSPLFVCWHIAAGRASPAALPLVHVTSHKRHLSNETTGGSPEVISINPFPSSKSLHQTSPPCLLFSFLILSFAPHYPQFLFLFCSFRCFCWRCLLGWMRSSSGLDSKYGSSSH